MPPRSPLVVSLDGWATEVKLETTGFAAVAGSTLGKSEPVRSTRARQGGRIPALPRTYRVMPPLAAEVLWPSPRLAEEHQTAADAGSQDHAEHDTVAVLAASAKPGLGERKTVGVVLERHRATESLLQVLAKRATIQAHRVAVLHNAVTPRHGPGHANTHGQLECSGASAPEHSLDQLRGRVEDRSIARLLGSWHALTLENFVAGGPRPGTQQNRLGLGPPQVDPHAQLLGRHSHPLTRRQAIREPSTTLATRAAVLIPVAQEPGIQGPDPTPSDRQRQTQAECQQVIFEALAVLGPRPIHEKTARSMHEHDRSEHGECDAYGAEAAEEAQCERDRSEQFGDDHERRHGCGHPEGALEPAQRPLDAKATKPTERLLQAVGQDDRGQYDSLKQACLRGIGREAMGDQLSPWNRTRAPSSALQRQG